MILQRKVDKVYKGGLHKKRTSIGSSPRTKPTHKNTKAQYKRNRGQGTN